VKEKGATKFYQIAGPQIWFFFPNIIFLLGFVFYLGQKGNYVSFSISLYLLRPKRVIVFASFFIFFLSFVWGKKEACFFCISLYWLMPKRKIVLHPCKDFRVKLLG
jgi:hypothetical protein